MTYKETLEWMFEQLPMYQQKGASAYNGKLDKILHFAAYLGNPETKFKSIHVGGTNGKGSSAHMLASVLQEAGYKVGLYTSPHLKDFRERIKINGREISKKKVKDFIALHKAYLDEHQLSFFEMTVGMAFCYFADKQVDIAVIEVGLGGRLDSTNIITPEVSLITNIGLDHQHILGGTLQKIALEKAGIIKKDVPVIISERQSAVEAIFRLTAARKSTSIVFADELETKSYKTDLLGTYQQQNIKGVVATLKILKGFKVTQKHLKKGFQNVVINTGLLGRWQVLQNEPLVVCDTAHNPAGLELVIKQIIKQRKAQVHFVLGFVEDKNIEELLRLIPQKQQYYFVSPKISRGMNVQKLKRRALDFGLKGEAYKSVKLGYKAALQNATLNDLIFIGGSTFVVAEII